MIPEHVLHYLATLETAAAMKLTGIAVKGIRKTKDGKVAKLDKAPTHVKQKRRRTKGKVTGARSAK